MVGYQKLNKSKWKHSAFWAIHVTLRLYVKKLSSEEKKKQDKFVKRYMEETGRLPTQDFATRENLFKQV